MSTEREKIPRESIIDYVNQSINQSESDSRGTGVIVEGIKEFQRTYSCAVIKKKVYLWQVGKIVG